MTDFDFSSSSESPSVPIADLSYRGYQGHLHTRAIRWWIVALELMRVQLQKRAFWVLTILAVIPYVVIIIATYIGSSMGGGGASNGYALQFFQAITGQAFFIMLLGLVIGSGAIAADNRANALLVYLSKPITKSDYLLGKWMGIFLVLYGTSLLPALIAFTYCAVSLAGHGFYQSDPHLVWRIVFGTMIAPVVHASLLVGFSAWSKSARAAGAAYFGFFIITGLFSGIAGGLELKAHAPDGRLIQSMSVQGSIQGLAQNVYQVKLPRPRFDRDTGEMVTAEIAAPPLYPILAIVAGLSAAGIAAARMKIRAVEVVRG